jgi:ABC-type multidrug transport system ATPase subunit
MSDTTTSDSAKLEDPAEMAESDESADAKESADTDTVLEVEGLKKRFGSLTVLEDITVSFPTGQVVGIIGANGSGKTTLLRLLVGDLSPTAGTVSYRGPPAERQLGYLPQRTTFRPEFTAHETLSFYASLVDGPDPETLLERVGLQAAADRRVDALSGGMRQLLGIAQAMVGDPPVVILDEPASGLDANMSQHVFDAAAETAQQGNTVLLSSHDLELVAETADTVVLLSEGRVLETGPPEALCERFDAESLRAVLSAIAEETGGVEVAGANA